MADYLNIAGRVRTTASDGVAMEAQEVKDLNQNKSQQEINADVQTELGDRYTKEETYSKEQLDDLITTPDVNYVSVVATNATTAVTDILPATGEANTIYRVGNWNGTQYDPTMYALFAWNGTAYVCLAVRSFVGEVYDVSVNHPDGQGNPTPYPDLAAALGTNGENITADIRRGGMSIKFIQGTVQSSDNKYAQYRLMSDEFTTDTTQWAIADEGVYVENPEFVYVETDKDDKILWAIKKDGDIYFGAGCPQQVKDYIENKISSLSLDEYDDIVAFLSDYLGSDTTLKVMIDGINAQIATKVDKEEDKSLIPTQYIQEVENPEFIKAELDAEQKLLGGIKKDGAYWFNKIESPTLDNLQKEVNDAIEESQEALIEHYDYYNVSKHHTIRDVFNIYTANTGWQQVEYDSTAAMYDELDVYQIGEVCNYGEDTEHSYEAIISQRGVVPAIVTQEYVTRRKFTLEEAISVLPAEILTAFAAGQMICFVDLDDIVEEWQLSERGNWVRVNPYEIKDPEGRVEIKLDNDNKIIAYRKADGTWVECVGIEAPNLGDYVDKEEGKGLINSEYAESVDVIEDPEGRSEITTDVEGKIISYRDGDGVKHENAGIETDNANINHLNLTDTGMTEFQQALKDAGFQPGGGGDWSEKENIELPEPKHYSLLNIVVDRLPINDSDVSTGYIEYYDGLGNYFKMDCSLEAQGQTSRIFARTGGKGNYTLDLPKDVKFGSWVPQDSFHLKGAAKDVVRGILPTSYKWAWLFMNYLDAKPNRVLMNESEITTTHASGDRITDWPTDARCLPDGFPVEVYINGEYWGLYSWQLKKHRKNYSMDKKDYTSFFLDADKMMSNDYTHGIWNDGPDAVDPDGTYPKWWNGFDIKGPKDLVCMDGSAFDGDNPKELIDSTSPVYDSSNKKHKGSATTKNLIRSFSTRYNEVKALIDNEDIDEAKSKFNEYFDYDACMLVYIYNCLMKNGDSVKKNTLWGMYKSGKIFPALWDLDGMYGQGWIGNRVSVPSASLWYSSYATAEWPLSLLWDLYKDEINATYVEFRDNNIICIDAWHNIMFKQWVERIGQDAYERDIERWPETPSYRENLTNTDYWAEIGSTDVTTGRTIWNSDVPYSIGTEVLLEMYPGVRQYIIYRAVQASTGVCPVTEYYNEFPKVGGYYDSPKRMEKWMEEQIKLCDIQNDYFKELVADFTAYRTTDEGYEIECTNMTVDTKLSKEYNYIQGHITRHETVVEGQTVSTYTIDSGIEAPEDTSKTYTTVKAAIEAAVSQEVDVPSENVYYIKARAKNINYHKS